MSGDQRFRGFVLAVLAALPACAYSPAPLGPQQGRVLPTACAHKSLHLTIIGDSLAKGYGASTGSKNFAALVSRYVEARRPGSGFSNLGTPGANTRQITQRELPQLRSVACALVVVVAGANDVQQFIAPARFSKDYDTLLAGIRRRDPRAAMVVTNIPDVALSRIIMPPVKPIISTLAARDSDAIARAAHKYGAWTVDLWDVSRMLASRRARLLSRDGIHPNDEGYAVMAAVTFPLIDRAIAPQR